ncbi:MAG: thioredoxin domain-containing protein [Verrucomicrobiales bacterium]|nr:thioredoxin domain-containing protein [Verrucomicrobiales bacterium]
MEWRRKVIGRRKLRRFPCPNQPTFPPLHSVTGFSRTVQRDVRRSCVKTRLQIRIVAAFVSVLFLTLALYSPVQSQDEEPESKHHVRKPLPPAEEIAKLPKDGGKEFNRLVFEKSPYLLQHARNPVDWWPWGEKAFAQAKKENKPVFLSIGYTTCHWCHVMEHESFEDEEVGKLINEKYIPIKVDREERPDIDEVYMTVTQAMTGRGGWPMTVVMTPDKKPFFAGTYFPKRQRGMTPGIMDVLEQLSTAWENDREKIDEVADDITLKLGEFVVTQPGDGVPPETLETAYEQLASRYDAEHGGFGAAPKFPVPPNLMYLLRYHQRTGDEKALEMVEKTLTEMRKGGVYDHVGYGTHRYSTDPIWLLPHFEKMLYDQALVAIANLEAYQVTGKEQYARTAREIFTYVLRDMTSPEGGFYSAEDADSEGEEGKFYVWTPEEVIEVLGKEDGEFFNATFNIVPGGNFVDEATRQRTGESIPHLRKSLNEEDQARFESVREKLWAAREKRIHPQKDDKVLTDWNGLMIAAFARGAQVLGDEEYRNAAVKAADFVLETLTTEDGRLLKRYRDGEAGLTAHLEDYAFLTWGLLDLYEATFDPRYLERSIALTGMTMEHFRDDDGGGGFFMTADDSEELIVRMKKIYGGAIPSGNAVSLLNLSRLYRMTGEGKYADEAEVLIKAFSEEVKKLPGQFPLTMCALDFHFGPSYEVVVSATDSESADEMISALRKPFLPNKVVMLRTEQNADKLSKLAGFIETMVPQDGKATAYVCVEQTCNRPTNSIEQMLESMKSEREEKSE